MIEDGDLAELARYIDWTPFFQTWELKGRYPAILEDDDAGRGGAALFADAQAMLKQIIAEKWFAPKAVVGFWPAGADGDDIHLYDDESRGASSRRFFTLRQQLAKRDGRPNLALADFVAPSRGRRLYRRLRRDGRASRRRRSPSASRAPTTIIPRSWSRRSPTASPRRSPRRCTRACGASSGATRPTRRSSPEELIEERYRGIRPAPGYPAQPDHTEKATLFALLDAEARIGVGLTESFAMWPGSSVSGLYIAHPRGALFRRRQGRARSGRGLRGAQGHAGRAKSSAGWRRC